MRTLRRAISMMQRIPRITPPSQMRDGQFAIRNFEVSPEKLDVRRWMLDVRASARHGPVAQRLEQGTHNPLVPGSNPGGPSPESALLKLLVLSENAHQQFDLTHVLFHPETRESDCHQRLIWGELSYQLDSISIGQSKIADQHIKLLICAKINRRPKIQC